MEKTIMKTTTLTEDRIVWKSPDDTDRMILKRSADGTWRAGGSWRLDAEDDWAQYLLPEAAVKEYGLEIPLANGDALMATELLDGGADIRICHICGKAMVEGYICEDDYTYYCGEKCLTKDLDEIYGEDGWGWTEEEYETDRYIRAGEDELNIYWTEWR